MVGLRIDKESLLSIVNASLVGMLLVDTEGQIVFSNTVCGKIFGVTMAELDQLNVNDLIPARMRQRHSVLQKMFFENPDSIQMGKDRLVKALKKTGEELFVEVGLSPFMIDDRNYVLVSVIDATDKHRVKELEVLNKELENAATRDVLTGLPNRRLIYSLIDSQLNIARRSALTVALMFLDLDGFKDVNDCYGHSVGDHLLQQVGTQLDRQIRRSDCLGRLGGDEFILCFTDLRCGADVERMANNLLQVVSAIDCIDGIEIDISASIGVCFLTVVNDCSIDDMIKIADEQLYEAKKLGKGIARVKEYDEHDVIV